MSSIALVGRPNVGKSTLFNRLVKKKIALTHETPGLTRDRKEQSIQYESHIFTFIDTPGLFDPIPIPEITEAMYNQTRIAIQNSDLVFFLIDAKDRVLPIDLEILSRLRKFNKEIWLIMNKCEKNIDQALLDGKRIHSTVFCVSAEHGLGIVDLIDALQDHFEENENSESEEKKKDCLKLTIMGRPNVGKSTLINGLINQERLLTADYAGVTRDAISLAWEYKGRAFELVDTAGIRKKTSQGVELMAIKDAKEALRYTHAVILMIDASTPLEEQIESQDLSLADQILQEGRPLVIALNKWDKVKEKNKYMKHINEQLSVHLSQGKDVPCIPIIATQKENTDALMQAVFNVEKSWNRRLTTGELNRWFQAAVQNHQPPFFKGRRLKLKYVTQIKTRPPTFVIFANHVGALPDSYMRYLTNSLKKEFKMEGTPIRIRVKGNSKNPYV
jgi:GTP-binding protein